MTRKELRESVERYLQGKRNERWSDSEINSYLDEAQLEFCRLSKIPETEVSSTFVASSPTTLAATLSVSIRNVTVVTESAHSLSVGDSILVTDSDNTARNGGFLVTKVTDTVTFNYLIAEGLSQTATGDSINLIKTGPITSKPSSILEVTGVTLNGRELAFYTQSDLDRAAHAYGGGRIMDTVLGPTMSPFNSVGIVTSPKSWRDVDGKPEAVVMSERSASSFRVFPLPSLPEHIYVEKDATTKVSLPLIIKGVIKPTALSADTSTPDIPESYHEALIYGALDRAYMKESQLRNVDKSNMFRGRFLGLVGEAQRNEGLNSGSLGGGRNEIRIRVSR
jgi:hypothetical protein